MAWFGQWDSGGFEPLELVAGFIYGMGGVLNDGEY